MKGTGYICVGPPHRPPPDPGWCRGLEAWRWSRESDGGAATEERRENVMTLPKSRSDGLSVLAGWTSPWPGVAFGGGRRDARLCAWVVRVGWLGGADRFA